MRIELAGTHFSVQCLRNPRFARNCAKFPSGRKAVFCLQGDQSGEMLRAYEFSFLQESFFLFVIFFSFFSPFFFPFFSFFLFLFFPFSSLGLPLRYTFVANPIRVPVMSFHLRYLIYTANTPRTKTVFLFSCLVQFVCFVLFCLFMLKLPGLKVWFKFEKTFWSAAYYASIERRSVLVRDVLRQHIEGAFSANGTRRGPSLVRHVLRLTRSSSRPGR